MRFGIELESDNEHSERYDKEGLKRQKAFENAWDLREGFGRFSYLFDGLVKRMEDYQGELDPENFARRRFFRVADPIKIPLTPIKEPITRSI